MLPPLTPWHRLALAVRLLTGSVYAVQRVDTWPDGQAITHVNLFRWRSR